MKYWLLIILLLSVTTIHADNPRRKDVFTSANDKYELRLSGSDWHLFEKTTKKEIYRIENNRYLSAMTVLISDDGESVIGIDDYSEQNVTENPEVLIFYRNGEKIKGFRLNELIDGLKGISHSVSHFQWFFSWKKPSIKDSKLTIKTYQLDIYTFDVDTGEILTKEKDEVLTDDAVYVYGIVNKIGKKLYEIEVICVISGDARKGSKIQFGPTKENKSFFDRTPYSLVFRNGKVIYSNNNILNTCQ